MYSHKMKKNIPYHLYWFVLLITTFIIALSMSWKVLASVNFAYPLLHDYTGINENIERHAPFNRIKHNFNQTVREERFQLFDGIVGSIQHQGEGLEELVYHTKSGREIRLLTEAEVIHLRDVADLYEKLMRGVPVAIVIWLGLVVMLFRWRMRFPETSVLSVYAVLPPVIALIVYVMGAEQVFYRLHTLVFPEGHQWFFYYEESLMSMMMKAPDMFAYVAIMLVIMASVVTATMFWLYKQYLPR